MPSVPQEIASKGTFYEKDGICYFKCHCNKIRQLSKNLRNRFSNIKSHLKECSEVNDDDSGFEEPLKPFSSFSFVELSEEACPFWEQKYEVECSHIMTTGWTSLGYFALAVCLGYCIALQ